MSAKFKGPICTGLESPQDINSCHLFWGDNLRLGECFILFTWQMHSRDYIYEGKSTNDYVSDVDNCLLRFKTPYLISEAKFLCGATSPFKGCAPTYKSSKRKAWLIKFCLPIIINTCCGHWYATDMNNMSIDFKHTGGWSVSLPSLPVANLQPEVRSYQQVLTSYSCQWS